MISSFYLVIHIYVYTIDEMCIITMIIIGVYGDVVRVRIHQRKDLAFVEYKEPHYALTGIVSGD